MTLKITNEQDRRTVAAILVGNGYTVKQVKIKVGKTSRTALQVENENEES